MAIKQAQSETGKGRPAKTKKRPLMIETELIIDNLEFVPSYCTIIVESKKYNKQRI